MQQGHFDWIERALEKMRSSGMPAGIGGHYIRTIMACVEEGFEPDFWMKTLHHHNYWSAQPERQHDNIWCEDPQQTIAFMEQMRAGRLPAPEELSAPAMSIATN